MSVLATAALLLLTPYAVAAVPAELAPTTPPVGQQDTAKAAPPTRRSAPKARRDMWMEANFRSRYLAVPSSIMDIWFFDSDDEGANPFDRPKLRLYSFGVEYVIKPQPMNWIFYYEYVGSGIKEGYWDDAEEPADHDDGDWIKPTGFGMHVLGANYAHEIEVSPSDRSVWVSMLFSAGLGLGILAGEMETWHPGSNTSITNQCLRDAPSYERKDECPSDGAIRLPGVLPVLDLTVSTRVNFANKANARLDFGLHDMFYVGGAVGTVF